ncbi:MAG: ABC transporter transmembrane domain-containing protein, partial [Pseudomonadota bacterium]|nr:ABC transporter transmembrane domain-containing protein [Pseudomonadota bacterium]
MSPNHRSAAEIAKIERAQAWRTILRVGPYLWPRDNRGVKVRVVAALSLLVVAKVISVGMPFLYKAAVDTLSGEGTADAAWTMGVGAVGLTVAYGMARIMNVGFQELRDVVFARVAQRALRMLALETFQHIHRLSMRFHITRKTGGLSRIIERGVKGVAFLLRFMLFSIGPLALELLLVAVIFYTVFDARYLAVVVLTIWAYVQFTFKVTEWRVRIRRQMNDQ